MQQCEKNPKYMSDHCAKACDTCEHVGPRSTNDAHDHGGHPFGAVDRVCCAIGDAETLWLLQQVYADHFTRVGYNIGEWWARCAFPSPIHHDTTEAATYTRLAAYIGPLPGVITSKALVFNFKKNKDFRLPSINSNASDPDKWFVWGSVAMRLYTTSRITACLPKLPPIFTTINTNGGHAIHTLKPITIEPVWYNKGDCGLEEQCYQTTKPAKHNLWANKYRGLKDECDQQICFLARQQSNAVAVPYPTFFRAPSIWAMLAHQEWMQQSKRATLFAFGAAPHGQHPVFRLLLTRQCAASEACDNLDCFKTGPNSCKHDHAPFLRAYHEATFCLQPDGDTPTRQGIFDAILAGCIPVFFSTCLGRDLFYEQVYAPFLPPYERLAFGAGDWAVVLNATAVYAGGAVETMLRAIPETDVHRMQARVVEIAPRVQYSTHEFGMRDARSILRSVLGMPSHDVDFASPSDPPQRGRVLARFNKRWGSPTAYADGRRILTEAGGGGGDGDGDGDDTFRLVVDALARAHANHHGSNHSYCSMHKFLFHIRC